MDAHHRQQHVAVAQKACEDFRSVVPPQAHIQLKKLQTVALHHLPALPQGAHGADAGLVDEYETRHPQTEQNRNGSRRDNDGAQHKGRDHSLHELGVQRVIQHHFRAQQGYILHDGREQLHGPAGKGRHHKNHGCEVNAAKDNNEQDQAFQQDAAQQHPEPLKAQPKRLGRHILPPANAQHGGLIAQLYAHGDQRHHPRQHRLRRGQERPPAHTAQTRGLGHHAVQQQPQQRHQCGQSQRHPRVNRDNALCLGRVGQPPEGAGLYFLRVLNIHTILHCFLKFYLQL